MLNYRKNEQSLDNISLQKCFFCLYDYNNKLQAKKENSHPKCDKCNNYGHWKENCLIYPKYLSEKEIYNSNLTCITCGSRKHLICQRGKDSSIIEDYNSSEYEVSDDEEMGCNEKIDEKSSILNNNRLNIERESKIGKQKKLVFLNIANEKIEKTPFCYYCGGMHQTNRCLVKERVNLQLNKKNENKNY